MQRRARSGVSIIEVMVVLAVLGIVFGIGYSVLPRDRYLVNQAVERFERDIQRARFNALSHNTELRFSVGSAGYVAEALSTDPGANRADFEVAFERVGLSGVEVDVSSSDDCGGAGPVAETGVWRFDSRGVGRQDGVARVVFGHRTSDYQVALCVNSYGRVERQ